jgi:LEA14-like dessication related protein
MRTLAVAAALTLAAACSRPKPPTITPVSIAVTSVGPTAVGLHVDLNVHNPNGFPLVVQKVSGKFVVNGSVDMGTTSVGTALSVPANADQRVATDVSVPWTNLAALAPLALSGQPVPYSFSGTATVGGSSLNVDVPFTIDGKLTSAQIVQAGLEGLPKIPGLN